MKAFLSPRRACDLCDQKIPWAQNEILSDDGLHHAGDFTHSGTRKESKGSNIDSQNRSDCRAQLMHDAQDGSIATHHDEQLRLLRK